MFIPVRKYHSRGSYPSTEDQLRHLFRHRVDNGLAPAFTKVQGRVLFDPAILQEILTRQAASESCGTARGRLADSTSSPAATR
jgi:hypothetical protein